MKEKFERATADHGSWKTYLASVRKAGGSKETAQSAWAYLKRCEYWRSNTYQVAIDKTPEHGFGEEVEVWHLSFKRNDRAPFHDWRVAQDMKNQLCGPEKEGIELYPAESRLVDTSNQYHLYVFMNEGFRVPVGWTDRCVIDETEMPEFAKGAKQRPLTET